MDKIDMSLDDIIKQSQQEGLQANGRSGGPKSRRATRVLCTKRNHIGTGSTTKGRQCPLAQACSNRRNRTKTLSPNSSGPVKLTVSNLNEIVCDADIQELFSELGSVQQGVVHYDQSGRSLGTAHVVFERKMDAIKAIKQFHGVLLDGQAMCIQLAGPWSETSKLLAVKEPIRKTRHTEQCYSKRASKGRVIKTKQTSRGGGGGITNRGGRGALNKKKKSALMAKDLDKELDSYLKAR